MILNLSEIAIESSEYFALGVLLSEIELKSWTYHKRDLLYHPHVNSCVPCSM